MIKVWIWAAACALSLSAGWCDGVDHHAAALRRMVAAVNTGDAAGYAALYAPDAVIAIYGSGEIKGRPAIEKYEADLLAQFPGARLAFLAAWQKDGQAVVHYGVNGRTPAGQSMGHEGLLFFRFGASGLIEEEHRYLDGLTPMAQMGMLKGATARALPYLPSKMQMHDAGTKATEEANQATVRLALQDLQSRKETAFLARLGKDATADELIFSAGMQNFPAWFRGWSRTFTADQQEVRSIIGVGDYVLAEILLQGRLLGPVGPLQPSPKDFTVHRAIAVELKEGKLVRWLGFINGIELATQLGQWPVP